MFKRIWQKLFGKKPLKVKCGNCQRYNPYQGVCSITVVHEGEYLELTVNKNDDCHWMKYEEEERKKDPSFRLPLEIIAKPTSHD